MEIIERFFKWHSKRFSATPVVLGIIFWVIAWAVWSLWWFIFLIVGVMVLEMGWAYGLERLHRGRRAE